jgi:hypothetical protein
LGLMTMIMVKSLFLACRLAFGKRPPNAKR